MLKFNLRNEEYIRPPGTLTELLSHPDGNRSKTMEVALFFEHRYAFFFWLKWARQLIKEEDLLQPPALVSLDWHQDLCYPEDHEDLKALNLNSNKEIALYTWANLHPNNDGQIMSAAYLNRVGNIYVHCRQGTFKSDWEDEYITDMHGSIHTVKKFKTFESLEKCLLNSDERHVFFDIDLDFFSVNNPFCGVGKNFTYLKDTKIKEMLSFSRPFIQWVFNRLCGLTIAMEPEHTGGLTTANKYLDLLNEIFFEPSLFTNYGGDWDRATQWKHLKRK